MANPEAATSADPVTTEVIRNYLLSAGGEMHRTLVRTAYNTVIYEILDFGINLYDEELNLIADSPGLAAFIGANDIGIRNAVEHVGEENLDPGDVLMLNYPYWSAGHTSDALIFSPVFYDDEIVGYGAVRAHWLDVGGKDPGYQLDTTDVYQEGLIMPGVKLYKEGEPDEELLDILRFNSRMPREIIGNLNAQISAIRVGGRRLRELHERYGTGAVRTAIDRILDHGERTVRERLRAYPDGTWAAEDYLDDDGITDERVRMAVEVTIDGGDFTVDFSDSPEQTEGPVNAPYGRTETAAKLVLKAITVPREASNGGHFRPLDVVAPEGTLFHATHPAPTFTHWSATLATETIVKALAKGIPEHLPASSGNELCGLNFYGEHPETGNKFVEFEDEGVGYGGTRDHDGGNGQIYYSGARVKNIPTEVFEHKVPLVVERYELRQDSGGAGEFRGGLGAQRDYRITDPVSALSINKKTKTEGWGLEGGKPGAKNAVVWRVGTDDEEMIGTNRTALEPGDRVSMRPGGGGGYGEPYARDPAAVREDVRNGYVSRAAAREEYGVVVTPDGELDREETARLRSA